MEFPQFESHPPLPPSYYGNSFLPRSIVQNFNSLLELVVKSVQRCVFQKLPSGRPWGVPPPKKTKILCIFASFRTYKKKFKTRYGKVCHTPPPVWKFHSFFLISFLNTSLIDSLKAFCHDEILIFHHQCKLSSFEVRVDDDICLL